MPFLAHTSVFPQTHERWGGEPVTVSNDTAAFLVWEAAFSCYKERIYYPLNA